MVTVLIDFTDNQAVPSHPLKQLASQRPVPGGGKEGGAYAPACSLGQVTPPLHLSAQPVRGEEGHTSHRPSALWKA